MASADLSTAETNVTFDLATGRNLTTPLEHLLAEQRDFARLGWTIAFCLWFLTSYIGVAYHLATVDKANRNNVGNGDGADQIPLQTLPPPVPGPQQPVPNTSKGRSTASSSGSLHHHHHHDNGTAYVTSPDDVIPRMPPYHADPRQSCRSDEDDELGADRADDDYSFVVYYSDGDGDGDGFVVPRGTRRRGVGRGGREPEGGGNGSEASPATTAARSLTDRRPAAIPSPPSLTRPQAAVTAPAPTRPVLAINTSATKCKPVRWPFHNGSLSSQRSPDTERSVRPGQQASFAPASPGGDHHKQRSASLTTSDHDGLHSPLAPTRPVSALRKVGPVESSTTGGVAELARRSSSKGRVSSV